MALTDLRRRKQTNLFNVYDLDDNGFVEQEDLRQFAVRLGNIRNWAPDSPDTQHLAGLLDGFWSVLAAYDTDGDGKVSLDEWLAMHESFPRDRASGWGEVLFDVLDADSDGQITINEYRQFFEAAGVGADFVDEAFPTLDDDGDGTVSKTEFIQHIIEFDGADGDAPGNVMFGPL